MGKIVRFWDALLCVLVVFPLLTGGVWIKRPGLFLELSELGVPVIVVTIIGLGVFVWLRAPLESSLVVQGFRRLWSHWSRWVSDFPKITLWSAAALVTVLWSWVAFRRHWNLATSSHDLGIFTNAIWNLTHGNGYYSSVKDGISLFADHQSPLFWLTAPFFMLVPRAETLLFLQAAGLATGGVALYYLARQYLPQGKTLAWAALPLMYWAYLPLRNANAFEFHPEVFMLPLFLWGIVGIQTKENGMRALGALALLLALGGKESAGLVAVGIGTAWLLRAGPLETRDFTRWAGLALAFSGLGVFLFDLGIVPGIYGRTYVYGQSYSQFGGNLHSVLMAPFKETRLFFNHLFGQPRLKFLFWTLSPLAFLPLLGWRALVASVPGYMILFLSDNRLSLQFHYIIEAATGLFWAATLGFKYISDHGRKRTLAALPLWLLFWGLATFGRSELYRVRVHQPDAHRAWVLSEVLPCLDGAASMSATDALVPHLATRKWIHELPETRIPREGEVACIVVDSQLPNWPMSPDNVALFVKTVEGQGRRADYRCGSLQVFGAGCLKCNPRCLE